MNISTIKRVLQNEFLFEELISHCAGKVSEDRLHGRKDQNWRARRASGDRELALRCALKLSDGDDEAAQLFVQWAERRAAVLVEKHWPKVQALAFALREKEKFTGNSRLNGAEIRAVLRSRNGSGNGAG
jgi:hypothetical protein